MKKRSVLTSIGLSVLVLSSGIAYGQSFDLIIKNAMLLDGRGGKAVRADLGIESGKINKIGDLEADKAKQVIDAKGKVVAPGFIDLHSHAERSIAELPRLDNLVQQGITTILGGNCGFSPVDFKQFFAQTERSPLGPNLALLIGHNDVRKAVMGEEQRLATADELKAMQALVDKAMQQGAFGLSTGLKYVPGVYSNFAEVKVLAETAHAQHGFFASHMRDEGAEIVTAMNEVLDVAKETGIPVHISHHKLIGHPNWGESKRTIQMIRDARKAGLDVTLDQYPYTASSTRFAILFPAWSLAGGQAEVEKRLQDPELRQKIKQGLIKNIREDRGGGDPARLQIAHYAANPTWDGLTFAEVLKREGRAQSIDEAAELAMEIQANGGAQGIFHAINEDDVKYIMAYPITAIATDAGGSELGKGNPHPRGYGTFPRVLGHYVREQGVISLPDAIRKMTSLPAARMGLTDRGVIAKGYAADIVILDPATVADKSTFSAPHKYAEGIEFVIINGQVIKSPDGMTGKSAGQILRHTL
ncbi:N-acyl-D-amino-acid deacylase family protein [Pseudoalteromonas sp. CH_XMU1449-3]|uniref:N-acyl-D-amino-acid deacylase family protein n=1 Tax=Pseudoalteromonas sp. CH_XMU1449-3 TaxID=3107774 RepID=UPI0030080F18|tara:strand:+ start:325 stop:1911 length:1587 start_codon:yes stop_codon:yes gene_type:complete